MKKTMREPRGLRRRSRGTGEDSAKQKDYGPALCVLGLIDAALGKKEVALQEGHRAMELMPVEKDSINGSAS